MEETIAAIATAYGEGGIGIVRISGEKAADILNQIFVPFRENKIKERKLTYGHIIDKDETIDEVMAVYMKAPHTYTREDVVEINCHGSIVSLRKTLALVLAKGARIAEPGEFTKRAFLNGRLDLSQAEAVIDLIKARTDKSFDVALRQLDGSFSDEIKNIRKDLVDILVNVTVNIDYPDEDIEQLTYSKLKDDMLAVKNSLEKIISTAGRGRIIKEGLNVAIIGRPYECSAQRNKSNSYRNTGNHQRYNTGADEHQRNSAASDRYCGNKRNRRHHRKNRNRKKQGIF